MMKCNCYIVTSLVSQRDPGLGQAIGSEAQARRDDVVEKLVVPVVLLALDTLDTFDTLDTLLSIPYPSHLSLSRGKLPSSMDSLICVMREVMKKRL